MGEFNCARKRRERPEEEKEKRLKTWTDARNLRAMARRGGAGGDRRVFAKARQPPLRGHATNANRKSSSSPAPTDRLSFPAIRHPPSFIRPRCAARKPTRSNFERRPMRPSRLLGGPFDAAPPLSRQIVELRRTKRRCHARPANYSGRGDSHGLPESTRPNRDTVVAARYQHETAGRDNCGERTRINYTRVRTTRTGCYTLNRDVVTRRSKFSTLRFNLQHTV